MADADHITIPLRLPSDEAYALAQLTKRIGYDDIERFANRTHRYPDGRMEHDVMWAALSFLRTALAKAGFAPR